jgi:hypothetical protein
MARTELPSVKETARQILREVEAENQIKTAEQQILRGVLQSKCATDTGYDLTKVAAQLRTIDDQNPEVSYADLNDFMGRCNG